MVPTPALFEEMQLNAKLHKRIQEYLEPIKNDQDKLITDEVLRTLALWNLELRDVSTTLLRWVSTVRVPKDDMSLLPFVSMNSRRNMATTMVMCHADLKSELTTLIDRLIRVLNDGAEEEMYRAWCISAANSYVGSSTSVRNTSSWNRLIESIHRARPTAQLNNMAMNDSESTVIDYRGNEIPASEAVVLTRESEHEGEYIRMEDAYVGEVWTHGCEECIVITQYEADNDIRELVSRDIVHLPSMEDDIVYLDGGNYEGEFAWTDDTVYCEDDGCYYHTNDEGEYVFWNDRTGEYQCDEPIEGRCHDYHSGFRRNRLSENTVWTIGFEVEKEDDYPVDAHDLYAVDETGWCREEDGSLNDDGFELVSPVYDLFQNRMDNDIAESRILRDHINAEYSSNCGGHINFGKRGITGNELFDEIQAFVPLFITIWRHRLGNHYSQMKRKPDDYKRAGKYSAIHVKGSYLEIRVPPAVKSVNNLLWRRDLIRIVASNCKAKPLQVITMILSPKTALGQHLRKVYKSEEQIHKIVSMYAQFADDMYSSFNFTSDGAGVFIKSAVRRLKNRKVKGTQIVSYTSEATDRLRNTFGRNYVTDAQSSLEYIDELLNEPIKLTSARG